MWVNKMEAIFESNLPIGEREKIMTTSNNLASIQACYVKDKFLDR